MKCRLIIRILLLLALLSPGPHRSASAQSHFRNCVSMTGSSATVVLPASAAPSINGTALPVGAEIALFTEEDLCAGVAVWAGRNLPITVWGDDVVTDAKDGFEPDETFTFRVWDVAQSIEATEVLVSFSADQPFFRTRGSFEENAVYAIRALSATSGSAALPTTPVPVAPGRGEKGVDKKKPKLSWKSVESASSYRLQVATDENFVSILIDESGLLDTTYHLESLAPGTTYTWRVRAESEAGPSHFSTTHEFTTLIETGANMPPVFLGSPQPKTRAGRPYSYAVAAGDYEGDNVRLEAIALPGWLTFSSSRASGTLSGLPEAAHVGQHTVRLRAVDAYGAQTNQYFTITVVDADQNTPPRALVRIPRQEMSPGGSRSTVCLSSLFEDEEGDPLTFRVSSSDESVVQPSIEDQMLLLAAVSPGIAVVQVFAEDDADARNSTSFEVQVAFPTAVERIQPQSLQLAQNYPNPFNPRTTIQFTLDRPDHVLLGLYDLLGRRLTVLAEGPHAAGVHTVDVDAGDLPGGVYLYRLHAGGRSAARSLVVLK